MRHNRGFTLIEMLIVVAIIAILSGVVLAGVSNFQSRARDTRRIGDLRNIQSYLELYFNRCGRYPGGADASGCNTNNPASWSDLTTTMLQVSSKFPNDPVAGRSYCYGVSSDGLMYVVGGVLENDNSVLKENSDITGFTPFGNCVGQSFAYWVKS